MNLDALPAKPNLVHYERQARDLARNFRSAKPETMYWIRQRHPRLPGRPNTNDRNPMSDDDIRRTGVSIADARVIVAGMHQFETWSDFVKHIHELSKRRSAVAQFEKAADAIANGDAKILKRLLRENPELIRMRSTREHRATLLHYVGANAVEYYRQKTPKNAVKIAQILLDAGAEVDADLDYGPVKKNYRERIGSTTLGMAATSCHPAAAGVQIALMDVLIKGGASVNGVPGGWSIVLAALHNGRGQAAAHLAKRGARLDLEGAAGVGRLDVVKSFFKRNGSLKPNATKRQMELGFMWACEYGHSRAVDFLLERGMDVAAMPHGETALHWASYAGHANIVKRLLRHNPPIQINDVRFNATPLGWALHGWNEGARHGDPGRYYEIVARLVRAGATPNPDWLSGPTPFAKAIRNDPKMRAALRGELPRAARRQR